MSPDVEFMVSDICLAGVSCSEQDAANDYSEHPNLTIYYLVTVETVVHWCKENRHNIENYTETPEESIAFIHATQLNQFRQDSLVPQRTNLSGKSEEYCKMSRFMFSDICSAAVSCCAHVLA